MRLRVYSGARHFFFVDAEDLPQPVELAVHFIQHLPNCVHFQIAAFVAFERKPHRDVLREFQKRRFVRRFRGRLRRQRR